MALTSMVNKIANGYNNVCAHIGSYMYVHQPMHTEAMVNITSNPNMLAMYICWFASVV